MTRRPFALLAALALFACGDKDADDTAAEADTDTDTDTDADADADTDTDTDTDTDVDQVDADGDGEPSIADGGEDCDDSDASVYPGADEACDAVDSDCDGDLVDEFDDVDRDGKPDCADDDACATAPAGLFVWLQGEDATDAAGTAGVQGLAEYTPGIVGNAIDLDGQGGLLDTNPDPWLVSPLSIEAWLKTTPSTAAQMVLAHYECGGRCSDSPSAYTLRVQVDGTALFAVRDADVTDSTPSDLIEGATDLTDGEWHHVVAVLDRAGGELRLYVDGAADADPQALGSNDGSGFAQDEEDDVDPITVGFLMAATTGAHMSHFVGQIDELSVYDSALTDADAAALHGAGIAGKCALTR